MPRKYHNKITEYKGEKYHSKKEAEYARELDLRVKCKDIKSWVRQVKQPLVVNSIKIADYIIDFRIVHNNGQHELVEIKGMWTDVAKLKVKLFETLTGNKVTIV